MTKPTEEELSKRDKWAQFGDDKLTRIFQRKFKYCTSPFPREEMIYRLSLADAEKS